LTGLSTALEGGVQGPAQGAAWRASHRPGTPSRIETDPELRAFVLARIDRLTFDAVVSEIAAHFPPERRTSRAALYRWWHRHGKHLDRPIGKSWRFLRRIGNRQPFRANRLHSEAEG
jgi:hypothetical protein